MKNYLSLLRPSLNSITHSTFQFSQCAYQRSLEPLKFLRLQYQISIQQATAHVKKALHSTWSNLKLPIFVFGTVYSGFCGYQFYQCKLDWRKTKWQLALRHRQLWHTLIYGLEAPHEAEINSRFNTALPAQLTVLLSSYFLQLDIEKVNGVRKSDILLLLNSCGIDNPQELASVNEFILNKENRRTPNKDLGGCQLQDVLELVEKLISSDEIDKRTQTMSLDKKRVQNGSEFQAQLETYLRNYTRGSTMSMQFTLPNDLSIKSKTANIENQYEEFQLNKEEELEDDISRIQRQRDLFIQLEKRSGLTEAQRLRVISLTKELAYLESEVKRLKNKQVLQSMMGS